MQIDLGILKIVFYSIIFQKLQKLVMQVNWRSQECHKNPQDKRVASDIQPKSGQDNSSSAWKLKTELDESYEEEKPETPSYKSDIASNQQQIWSTILSDNHTTSIMQDKNEQKKRNQHFFQMLREKLPIIKAHSREKQRLTLRDINRNILAKSVSVKARSQSANSKEKVKALKEQRSKILQEIKSKLQSYELLKQPDESRRPYPNSNQPKHNLQKHSRIGMIKQMIFELHRDEQIKAGNCYTSNYRNNEKPEESTKRSGMMKNILSIKNKLIDCKKAHPKLSEPQIRANIGPPRFPLAKHRRQCQTDPIQSDSQILNEQTTPIEKLKPYSFQEQPEAAGINELLKTDNFTFGELTKKNMKQQLQLMKKHMKKVSIDFQEKDYSDISETKKILTH